MMQVDSFFMRASIGNYCADNSFSNTFDCSTICEVPQDEMDRVLDNDDELDCANIFSKVSASDGAAPRLRRASTVLPWLSAVRSPHRLGRTSCGELKQCRDVSAGQIQQQCRGQVECTLQTPSREEVEQFGLQAGPKEVPTAHLWLWSVFGTIVLCTWIIAIQFAQVRASLPCTGRRSQPCQIAALCAWMASRNDV